MTVMCLCCGQPARQASEPMALPDMRRGLWVLLAMGYSTDELKSKPEYVESLRMTSPGFVEWLRAGQPAEL